MFLNSGPRPLPALTFSNGVAAGKKRMALRATRASAREYSNTSGTHKERGNRETGDKFHSKTFHLK